MDPYQTCPNCQKRVRVPQALIGKKVGCPRCGTAFRTHSGDDVVDDVEVVEEVPADRRRLLPPLAELADDPPRRRTRRDRETDEFEEEYDDRPHRSSRGDVRARVQGPATALQVSGWIGIALCLLSVVYVVVIFAIALSRIGELQRAGARVNWAYVTGMLVGEFLLLAIAFACSWGVVSGAGRMKSLQDLSAARRAAILAIIPFSGCCLVGLPVGIWALVVLGDAQVQRAFRK